VRLIVFEILIENGVIFVKIAKSKHPKSKLQATPLISLHIHIAVIAVKKKSYRSFVCN
jgi:hypothetical protein